jgi:hypothetical protein
VYILYTVCRQCFLKLKHRETWCIHEFECWIIFCSRYDWWWHGGAVFAWTAPAPVARAQRGRRQAHQLPGSWRSWRESGAQPQCQQCRLVSKQNFCTIPTEQRLNCKREHVTETESWNENLIQFQGPKTGGLRFNSPFQDISIFSSYCTLILPFS